MKIVLLSILVFSSAMVYPKNRPYSEPLKIPILISGSFAELRRNHFHSGIDIKTQGETGLPVYSAAGGYISRIVVSPGGFGNALYIDHPNGTTSVYGHLSRFRGDIAGYVKNIQYKKERFTVDIPAPSGKFQVDRGELIAYSGNSGSSGGPHLHFEIRDTKTQEPLNPLKYNLIIKDNISPKIQALQIYPLNNLSQVNYAANKKEYNIVFYDGSYHIKNNPVIPVYGKIGFSVLATDYLNGTWSKCGINSLSLKVDGEDLFSFEIDRFSFSKTRFINSHIDYEEYMKSKRRFIKTWKDPGNKLGIYHGAVFDATDGETHHVEILLKDSYGNTARLEFQVKSKFKAMSTPEKKGVKLFLQNQPNHFEADGIRLDCPKGAFYTDFSFDYTSFVEENDSIKFSKVHHVHQKYTPIQAPVTLSIRADGLPVGLQSKSLIAKLDEKTGELSSFGGGYQGGWVTAKIRSFGDFVVSIDTIAPVIKALSIKNHNTLVEPNRIRFKITDSFSGVKEYKGYIDGKWVLFEYDAKNSLITYHIDPDRLELKKQHRVNLLVTDNKGNKSSYDGAFFK